MHGPTPEQRGGGSPFGLLLSAHRQMVWFNAALAALLGYSLEDLIDRSSHMLHPSAADFERIGGNVLHVRSKRCIF